MSLAAVDFAIEDGIKAEKEGHYLIAARYFLIADEIFEEGSDNATDIYYHFRHLQQFAQKHYELCRKKLSLKQRGYLTAEACNDEMRGGKSLVEYDREQIGKDWEWIEQHPKHNKKKKKTLRAKICKFLRIGSSSN